MKHSLRALAFLAALLPSWALAQTFPTVPDHTVIGRIGVGGQSGPSQAIPFASLPSAFFGAQPANQVYAGPSSGAASVPTFRLLVGTDLPAPGASSLGGVQSLTCSTSNWFRTLSTSGVFGCSQPAFTDITGSVAAGQLPNPTASTLGGVKSLAAVANNFLTSIGTTGLPTQAQPACTNLSDATSCNAARGQLPGEITTGSATAGNVGEYVESVIATGSAVVLVTGTAKTITSISLTAGDWDVDCVAQFTTAATTSVTGVGASLSLTTNTLDVTAGRFANLQFPAFVPGASSAAYGIPVPPLRFSFASTTSVFMVGFANFSVAAFNGFGIIRARRVR